MLPNVSMIDLHRHRRRLRPLSSGRCGHDRMVPRKGTRLREIMLIAASNNLTFTRSIDDEEGRCFPIAISARNLIIEITTLRQVKNNKQEDELEKLPAAT